MELARNPGNPTEVGRGLAASRARAVVLLDEASADGHGRLGRGWRLERLPDRRLVAHPPRPPGPVDDS